MVTTENTSSVKEYFDTAIAQLIELRDKMASMLQSYKDLAVITTDFNTLRAVRNEIAQVERNLAEMDKRIVDVKADASVYCSMSNEAWTTLQQEMSNKFDDIF